MSSYESSNTEVTGLSGTAQGSQTEEVTETVEGAPAQTPVEELSVDVIFEVLKNERRRRVIRYLLDNEGPAELGAIAEHIAALENDKEETAITYAERKRVYVGLYQCHLPKMDDMGVVDFNQARGRIELTDQTAELVPYLDGLGTQRPWHQYYGAVLLAGFGLYGLSLTGLTAGLLSAQATLLVVLGAVAVCATCHFASTSDQ